MSPRIPALLLLGALSGLAYAGIWQDGNPPGVGGGRGTLSGVRLQGLIGGYKLKGGHGREVVVRLPRPVALTDALRLPMGPSEGWADLTLELVGPVTVTAPGASPVVLEVDSLTVALEDPDAREVQLDWTLSEGLISALRVGVEVDNLAGALEDGGLAR